MQLQGLVLMIFMLITVPAVMLFSNHNAFFVIVAIILLYSSIKDIFTLGRKKKSRQNSDMDSEDDVEEMLNVDLKKFGIGTKVVKSLITILFFIYCSFFMDSFWIKALVSAMILYKLSDIIANLSKKLEASQINPKLDKALSSVVNISTILLILLTAYNKYFNRI